MNRRLNSSAPSTAIPSRQQPLWPPPSRAAPVNGGHCRSVSGGLIIHIASDESLRPSEGLGAYPLTKICNAHLAKQMAFDFGPESQVLAGRWGVRVRRSRLPKNIYGRGDATSSSTRTRSSSTKHWAIVPASIAWVQTMASAFARPTG